MKGDFTRWTFRPEKNYTGVLMQQGRVQMDSDWNEQVQIQNSLVRAFIKDWIGPHGGPEGDELGFEIRGLSESQPDFEIGRGHYYVEGALCRNLDAKVRYTKQPWFEVQAQEDHLPTAPLLVYLDSWERTVNVLEDGLLTDVALNGLDTAVRSQQVWAVRVTPLGAPGTSATDADIATILDNLGKRDYTLTPRVNSGDGPTSDCLPSPSAKYRGLENQLYRVEIHYGSEQQGGPTFKWSRDNGSAVSAIREIEGDTLTLKRPPRDSELGLDRGDWVELITSGTNQRTLPLYHVDHVDVDKNTVRLDRAVDQAIAKSERQYARRWDQKTMGGVAAGQGGVPIPADPNAKVPLEDGLSVQLHAGPSGAHYHAGDYWLIPARVATGNIEWPMQGDQPVPQLPNGVWHRYAPLAIIDVAASGAVSVTRPLQKKFAAQAK